MRSKISTPVVGKFVEHMFTKIVIYNQNDPSDVYIWLVQLDEGGIAQWLGTEEELDEGYRQMSPNPETVHVNHQKDRI